MLSSIPAYTIPALTNYWVVLFSISSTIEQVASIKSSLLLQIQMQNTQTLKLFTINIKTEIVYKCYWKCQAGKIGFRNLVVWIKEGGRTDTFNGDNRIALIKFANVSWEWISLIDPNCYCNSE
jgi:hypothetical protein